MLTDSTGEYARMYLDAYVDENDIIAGNIMTYGRWNDFGGEPWFFALRPPTGINEARVDFGSKFDERFGSINIHAKKLVKGELVTFRHENDEICFAITDARLMPSGEDFFLAG